MILNAILVDIANSLGSVINYPIIILLMITAKTAEHSRPPACCNFTFPAHTGSCMYIKVRMYLGCIASFTVNVIGSKRRQLLPLQIDDILINTSKDCLACIADSLGLPW